MVASSVFERTLARSVLLVAAAGGCGESFSKQPLGAGGAAGNAGASAAMKGGSGGLAGIAGAAEPAADVIELDGPPCDTRRAADCTGIVNEYSSNGSEFAGTPELADCEKYVSFDGCGQLVFSFDTSGCAVSVGPGKHGWKDADHLSGMRECLTQAFSEARFSCLASGTLAFKESCRIR